MYFTPHSLYRFLKLIIQKTDNYRCVPSQNMRINGVRAVSFFIHIYPSALYINRDKIHNIYTPPHDAAFQYGLSFQT